LTLIYQLFGRYRSHCPRTLDIAFRQRRISASRYMKSAHSHIEKLLKSNGVPILGDK